MAGQQKVISSTFNVSTVDETVSLQAQYAPNDNPTSSQIHNTWQSGDLYMRTKMTNETTWSDWHKIVGENGGETDFSFAISSNATSTNSTTPPSDCTSESSWRDTPQAVTEQKPYLWMRVKKKVWNESTQQYDVSSTSYARLSAEYNFIVDLENEMKNVALTEGGNTLTAVDFYFKVQAFYGTSNVLSDNECTVSASCSDSNVTLTTTAAKTNGIRVQVAQNVALANSTDITVTVTHTKYGTRTVVFTLAGVRGGENAILQELLPSLDTISFARQSDGSLTPASRNLDLSIKKTQGSQTIIKTISESGLTIRWSLSVMPTQPTAGSAWGQGTATGVTWSGNTMQIANSISAEHVCIASFNSSGTLVDRETIPVIKDGNNGEDALTLVLDTYAIAFPTDSNYSVESQITYTVGARMYLGNSSIPRTITSLTASLDVADGDIDVSRTSPANGVVIDLGEARFSNIIGVNVTAVCAEGTRTAKIILTAAPKGEKGTRGKVGRFFYYAGVFDQNSTSPSFPINDAQAPYFMTGNNFHVFNPEENPSGGSMTMSEMWAATESPKSFNSKPWEVMTDDFKYLITEAIFGSYAHFGSFIINGDWMISQHGVIYDTNGGIHTIDASHSYGNYNVNNAYTLFDVDYPNSSKPNANNFVPNFSVDGRTGATYQNKAQIRGELAVRELGQNAGWILSPYLEDYYKIPSIDGFDKDGILTMRLLFDGDDSDGYAPREGGGLLINEKKWNASTQKYEPYNVARYNREAWCVSSTDHPDDSYMFGGMSAEEPHIHGKTYIQSNQTHKEFYLGITSLGLRFQSDSWQTYRSNMQDGEVYVDDWDNLMVKNSRSYKQFNIVRDSGSGVVLPTDAPIGTIYYVKGTGSTTVSVTSGSNDWIEGWDDNNSKGNSVGIQSNSVQFVKTATHIWTMFIGI